MPIVQGERSADPYDAIFADEDRQRLRASLNEASAENPDTYARAKALSDRIGIPVRVVAPSLPEVEQRAKVTGYDALFETAPGTARFLSNPENAKLAHDEIDKLGAFERTVARPIQGPQPSFSSYASGLFRTIPQGLELARQGIRLQFADLIGSEGMRLDAQRRYDRARVDVEMSDPNFETETAKGVYGGLSSFMRMLPGLAASVVTRSPTPTLATMGIQTEAEAYGKYRGRGATPGLALAGAVGEGVTEVATELLPMSFLVKNMGKVGAGRFLTGLLAREIPTEQVATLVQDAIDTAIANPDKTWAQYAAERPAAAYQTLVATATQGLVMQAGNVAMRRIARAEQATADGDALAEVAKASQDLKLRERDPATFTAFVAEATKGGPLESVYVDAATFAQGAQQAGIDIARTMPQTAAALGDAIATGSDVRIPVAEFAAAVPGTTFEQAIIPELRTAPGAPTAREAGDAQYVAETERITAKILADHQQGETWRQSAAAVETQIFTELGTANRFTPEVNKAYAGFMSAFYATQAHRMGITPEEMFSRYPVRVQATGVRGPGVMDQPAREGFSLAMPADISRLKIPPAWTDVHVSDNPDSNLLAVGRDAKGRVQYLYSMTHTMQALATKFERQRKFNEALPALAAQIETDANSGREEASVLRLIAHSGFRVGSERNTLGSVDAFGATTLRAEHVNVDGDTVHFDFPGKRGIKQEHSITNAEIARDISARVASENGKIFNTTDAKVRAYLRSISADDFKVHDFRTWNATDAARQAIVGMPLPNSEADYWRARDAVGDVAAHKIGDTRKVALESYVDPLVFEGWRLHVGIAENAARPKRQAKAKSGSVAGAGGENEGSLRDASLPNEVAFSQSQPGDSPRAQIAFQPDGAVISLFKNADLSSFLHESGHLYLEILNDLASQPNAPVEIVADMGALLKWFHVEQSIWDSLSLEEKRPYHEQFARGMEAYLFEGRSPNIEMQSLFQRFRAWMLNVYRQLTALNVQLSDEVRGVMDRLMATNDQIMAAEQARNMAPLFATKPDGMSNEDWIEYQALGNAPTQEAVEQLQARSLRDMKWIGNARSKFIRDLQRQAAGERHAERIEARREVLSQPVYQAWQFLSGEPEKSDKPVRKPSAGVDPGVDSLLVAIGKAGGLDTAEAVRRWGIDPAEVKGLERGGKKSILRKKGGKDINTMLEELGQHGYFDLDVNGKADERQFEDKFRAERGGDLQYSNAADFDTINAGRYGLQEEAAKLTDEPAGKLDTNVLRERYGDAVDAPWRRLVSLGMTSVKDGIHPDVVAELINMRGETEGGFGSGDEMVQALLAAPPPRAAIDALTDQRMLEKHGELVDPQAIERAADAAVHNEARARMVATELRMAEKAVSATAPTGETDSRGREIRRSIITTAARDFAQRIISGKKIKDIRPSTYAAAAARAGAAAQNALGKDIAEVAAQKRNQLVNTYAAKAAQDAIAEIQKAVARFKRIAQRSVADIGKTRDADMVMAARAVLAEYGIGTKGKAAQEYLATLERQDPEMHRFVTDRIAGLMAGAKPVNELTLDEFRGLVDAIDDLMHLARRSRLMEVDGDLIDREEVQEALAARMEDIGVPAQTPGQDRAVTRAEGRLAVFQTVRAALRRVEAWVDAKDGGQQFGPFRRYIFQPIKDAADRYRTDRAAVLRQYRDLLTGIAPTLKPMKIYSSELGYTFGYDNGGSGVAEIVHAILHTGNASNKRKLLLGRGWAVELEDGTVDTSRWDAFIARMASEGLITKQHYDFAQAVWDMLDGTKKLAQKTHRDVFGHYFAEVTAEAVDTPFGRYAGGYVPALVDSRIVSDAKTRALMEEENSSMAYAFPTTAKGFTKARVEYNRPLLLDLKTLAQHIDKVLLFSHLEAPVRDVRRVLTSKEVAGRLNKIDPAAFDGMLTPWLNRAARQQVETPIAGDAGAMKFFTALRARAGMAAMFANVSNTVQQITGFSSALVKVDAKYLSAALADYVRHPREFVRAVAEADPYMATRMDSEVLQLNGEINDILLNPSVIESAQNWTRRHAYFMQAAVDNVMSPIIWTGAYNQAIERGAMDAEAKKLASSTVRETQGSNLPEDISRIESGNAFVRLFTQFAGYFNTQANLLGTAFAKLANEDLGLRKGAGRGLYILLFGFLAPAWIAEAITLAFRGGPGDDDRDGSYIDDWLVAVFGFGTLRFGTAMVPVIGQTANALVNTANTKPYDDRISTAPAISMIESAVRAPQSVYNAIVHDGKTGKAVKDVAALISLTVGVPASAVARPVSYAADAAVGKVNPENPVEMARGLVTGASGPRN